MKCSLCREDKALIKAHIIPHGFYRPLKTDGAIPEMHSNTPGAFPRRTPVGVFDCNILCQDCDAIMGPWDQHAQEVLLKPPPQESLLFYRGQMVGAQIKEFKYEPLKLFFISLLWRASISTQPFFKLISLGPHEETLRQMIIQHDPGSPEDYAVTLGRFEDPEAQGMLNPHSELFEGINYCRFYLTGVVAYIKVDHRPSVSPLRDFTIKENEPITVIIRSLHQSKDGKLMKEIAHNALLHHKR